MNDNSSKENQKVTLSSLKEGEDCILVDIDAGKGLEHKLLSLGILKGTNIKVIKNTGIGAVVLAVKDGRVAIGSGMSKKMIVQKL